MNRRTQFNQKIKRLTCFPIRPPFPYFYDDEVGRLRAPKESKL